jgi:hypothetical protein
MLIFPEFGRAGLPIAGDTIPRRLPSISSPLKNFTGLGCEGNGDDKSPSPQR